MIAHKDKVYNAEMKKRNNSAKIEQKFIVVNQAIFILALHDIPMIHFTLYIVF